MMYYSQHYTKVSAEESTSGNDLETLEKESAVLVIKNYRERKRITESASVVLIFFPLLFLMEPQRHFYYGICSFYD